MFTHASNPRILLQPEAFGLSQPLYRLLFVRVQELSAPGSRIAVEGFSANFYEPDAQARRQARMQQMREAAARIGQDLPDPEELWFIEERSDVADWLTEHG